MKSPSNSLFTLRQILFKDAVGALILINLILAGVAVVKDALVAAYLGTSSQADAFWLAFFIPDMVGSILIGSSLTVSCVPVFASLDANKQDNQLRDTFTYALFFSLAGALLLYVGAFVSRHAIMGFLGPKLDQPTLTLSISLFAIMLPSIVFIPFYNIGTAWLQVKRMFNIPALAPVIFNLIFLAAAVIGLIGAIPVEQGVNLLAISFLTGSFAAAAVIWIKLFYKQSNIISRPHWLGLRASLNNLNRITTLFFPYLLILITSQAVLFVERMLASQLEVGSVAALNYAFRVAQFPLWVFVAAVATVIYPSVSQSLSMGKEDEMRATLGKSIKQALLITIPLTIALFTLREPVISILFKHGSFNERSAEITAGILGGYTLTIVSQGISAICLRAFFAAKRTKTALLAYVTSAGLNIFLDFILVQVLGLSGLGYGAAIGSFVNAVFLLYLIGHVFKLKAKIYLEGLTGIIKANIVLIPLALAFSSAWHWFGPGGALFKIAFALTAVVLGLPLYVYALRFFKTGFFLGQDS